MVIHIVSFCMQQSLRLFQIDQFIFYAKFVRPFYKHPHQILLLHREILNKQTARKILHILCWNSARDSPAKTKGLMNWFIFILWRYMWSNLTTHSFHLATWDQIIAPYSVIVQTFLNHMGIHEKMQEWSALYQPNHLFFIHHPLHTVDE